MELTIEVGKFGDGIDPREHVCRRCGKGVICGLRSLMEDRRPVLFTGYDTLIIKGCSLFEPRKEE